MIIEEMPCEAVAGNTQVPDCSHALAADKVVFLPTRLTICAIYYQVNRMNEV